MSTNKDSKWLLDAEVQSKIEYVKGRWQVSLVFIDTKDPNHILIQTIGDYRSKRLAEIGAMYMQQNAAKDVRGTQKVNKDDYNFNNN
ncbi:hypothetical protein [Mesoflavibacter sp. CH_XMU1404-2]|uniref:hypothetical protein n=1 Tax=Mesoflavibacter sp. CH_XMU1404-2 TaxID=3107766 RepID=UPI00243E304B|tara:strand:- start:920 stop:1180 length:261 start_codon:yes stop_codon:yes gene_type:complete